MTAIAMADAGRTAAAFRISRVATVIHTKTIARRTLK
jgi:hypothetical protein